MQAGINVDNWLKELGAWRFLPLTTVDENVANSQHGGMDELLLNTVIMHYIFYDTDVQWLAIKHKPANTDPNHVP